MAQKQGAGSGAGQLSTVEATFYAAVDAATSALQVAIKAAHTVAAQRAANLAYHTTVLAARNVAIASGMPAGHLGMGSALAIAAGEAGLT